MSFKLEIKLPKVETRKISTPINETKRKWGFLELFETTMDRDLRTGNPWLDVEAFKELQIKIKRRTKHVRFNLVPTIYNIPKLTD